jgi:hypothetical protein
MPICSGLSYSFNSSYGHKLPGGDHKCLLVGLRVPKMDIGRRQIAGEKRKKGLTNS